MGPKRCKIVPHGASKNAVAGGAKRKEPSSDDGNASDAECADALTRNNDNNGNDDGDSSTDGCLHCRQIAEEGDVQVRCYDCSRYICSDCHWCHEFQANHEIRVCDRCDAFYCRHCDEMDQCDDCGEVVCASCSTLLSCKFCGGGLCEECATACGRCGIVLCNRDAKFAVDCDTCRLSYCLVCLASGGKDPCVRCGHRPSKRMEQLVHLRLKSIYKAFKQSSTNPALTTAAVSVTGHHGATISTVEKHFSKARGQKSKGRRERGAPSDSRKGLWDDAEDFAQDCSVLPSMIDDNDFSGAKESGFYNQQNVDYNSDRMHRYKEEQEKADAAAAALLAELEEEEEAAKLKKKKKNKKKERHQTKGSQDHDEDEVIHEQRTIDNVKEPQLNLGDTQRASQSGGKLHHELKPESQLTDDISLNEDSVVLESSSRKHDMSSKEAADQLEQQLWELVESSNVDGLNELLLSIKGVPGRALLRKNAKKALKRIRMEQEQDAVNEPEGQDDELEAEVLPIADSDRTSLEPSGELLSVVSETQVKSSSSFVGATRGRPVQAGQSSGKCECVLSMSPLIVGWVIGKGGQRIRDLMEESGARIWIDQESVGPSENRSVYVSGQRKNVDDAVQMIKELVSKAPISSAQSKQSAPTSNSQAVDISTLASTNGDALNGNSNISMEDKHDSSKDTSADIPLRQVADAGSATKHVITCDPRYVPLLIGRRGWEIKSIQDRSNAQVDIDQTVTPRRITISGTKESVAKAVDLVRDVLSYPTSQLQGYPSETERIEEEEEVIPPQHQQSYAERVASVDDNKRNVALQTSSGQDKSSWVETDSPSHIGATPSLDNLKNVPHTPPPSSLIMNTDAKSTISVSSSLSSTPEPTMSSGKSPYGQVFPLPSNMLPPMNGCMGIGGSELYIGETNRVGHVQAESLHPYHAFPPPTSDLPLGVDPFNHNINAPSSMFDQRNHVPLPAEANSPLSLLHLEPRHGINHQSQAMLRPSDGQGFASRGHNGHRSTQGLFDQPDIHRLSQDAMPNSGLWDHPVGASGHGFQPASTTVDNFQLDAAVEFLQNSNSQYNARAVVAPPPALGILSSPGRPAKEDSRIIDSLFATSDEPESSLLNGFDGLSINRNGAPHSMFGLFATSDSGTGASDPRQSFSDGRPTTRESDAFPSGFTWGG